MLPVICCPWLSLSVINLVTLHSAVRFKHHRTGPNPSRGGGYCFLSGCYAQRGVLCLCRMVTAYGGWLSIGIQVATLSVLSPRHPSPVSPQVSLLHCAPTPLPGIYCLCLFPSVVNLVTLHSAVRLKHHRARADTLLRSGLLFPLRLLPLRGEWSAWAQWLLLSGGWLSTRIPASTLSVLYPKLQALVSP